jgi:hypothetical protein
MGCLLTHKSTWRPIFSEPFHFGRSVVVPNHIFNAYNCQINEDHAIPGPIFFMYGLKFAESLQF